MLRKAYLIQAVLLIILSAMSRPSIASHLQLQLKDLQIAYPQMIKEVSASYITWQDGSRMRVRKPIPVIDYLVSKLNHIDDSQGSISIRDLERDSYEPLFRKMYGKTAREVSKKLVTVYWMPKVFGYRYPLRVTTVNAVDQKIRRISEKLEQLPSYFHKFVANPAGGYYWRKVKGESYLSAHSFGIAIDINSHYGNYWLWDWEKAKRPKTPLVFHNHIPLEIVRIFEEEGFLWGGHWYHYDTMHFEYRPELFANPLAHNIY